MIDWTVSVEYKTYPVASVIAFRLSVTKAACNALVAAPQAPTTPHLIELEVLEIGANVAVVTYDINANNKITLGNTACPITEYIISKVTLSDG